SGGALERRAAPQRLAGGSRLLGHRSPGARLRRGRGSFHGQQVEPTSSTSAPASCTKTPTAVAALLRAWADGVSWAVPTADWTASASFCTSSTLSAYRARASSATCAQSFLTVVHASCRAAVPSSTTRTSPSAVNDPRKASTEVQRASLDAAAADEPVSASDEHP